MASPDKKPSPEAQAFDKLDQATTPPAFVRDEVWLSTLLSQCQAQRFHGSLEIVFEKGSVQRVRRVQSLLPPHREEAQAKNG